MLVKLLPGQVGELWDILKGLIATSLPPTTYNSARRLNKVLEALLCGKLVCWLLHAGGKPAVVIVTGLVEDDYTEARNMLIFSLNIIDRLSKEDWKQGMATLKEHARLAGCGAVIFYSSNKAIIKRARELGARIESAFGLFDIN